MPEECVHAGRAARWLTRAAILLVLGLGVVSRAAAAPHDGVRLTDNLYDVAFVSATDGWAAGAFGTIARTDDGGKTWHTQVSHTVEHLYGVGFVDTRHGWIVGRMGIILHTDDGGETWQHQSSGLDKHLFAVRALDPMHATAVGDWGTILSTGDGGKTWQQNPLNRDVILNSEAWPDAQHGWIVGEAGTILVTSDGGATWSDQHSGVEKTLFGVSFPDAQRGWAVGIDGLILRTADGGQTWQVQHGEAEVSTLEQVGYSDAQNNPSLYDVAVAGQYGYAVGDNGAVFASEDGGATWHRKPVPQEADLRWIRAVSLVSGTHGGFVGASGLTVRIVGNEMKLSEKERHAAKKAD